MFDNYSVLMSVYYKEKANYLREAMMSIYHQTVSTDDFVLVCDGVLTEELEKVIADMQILFGAILRVYRLNENVGLGKALNFGLQKCKNSLVARMDSDDISLPNRCELQLNLFSACPDLSIVSGTVKEFFNDDKNEFVYRNLPIEHNEIVEFSKTRNPFNHPCVMYKKYDVQSVGSYKDFFLLEDYYLWIRMLDKGLKGYNIIEPILLMRGGSDLYSRRGGVKYAFSQIKLLHFMNKIEYISKFSFLKQSMIRTIVSISPNAVRKVIFYTFLRVKDNDKEKK